MDRNLKKTEKTEPADCSVRKILKDISWPKLFQALKYAFQCLCASAAIAFLIYFWNLLVTHIWTL